MLQENVVLAPLTTLGVGGRARFFVEAASADEVREAIEHAKSHSLPLFVLGGGSNLVVADAGWPGLVLKVAIPGISHRHGHDTAYFDVGGGENWDEFVAVAVRHNCGGIECLSGIPGSVGGTPVQNVGAYGQDVAETIDSLVALDVQTGKEEEFEKADCQFGYRRSIFNSSEHGRYVILRVTYALAHDGQARLAYADLKKHFRNLTRQPTLTEVREAVLEIRGRKGMLITPGDEDSRSAGSFFKNPVLAVDKLDEVRRRAAARHLEIPSYPALEALKKVSAAWLVENSGFAKGYSRGRVAISRRHALAIVNRGGATASEIVAFMRDIQRRVEETWGIWLEPEPVLVGF